MAEKGHTTDSAANRIYWRRGEAVRYTKPESGEWVRPIRRGYKLACCDCGLVHCIDFSHIPWGRGRKIIFRTRRDERATAAMRREMKKRKRLAKA